MRLREDRRDVAVRLKVGEINASVKREKVVDTNYEVQMPTATTSVRGTVFSVSADPVAKAGTVSVREGLVAVDPVRAGLRTVLVPAGKEVEVTATAITKLSAPGKAGARGGTSRVVARRLVLAELRRAPARCRLRTPRSQTVASTEPARKGWLVAVSVSGKVSGRSTWSVRGKRVTAVNRTAKRVARGCR